MISNIEYDELVHQVIKYFKNKKFNGVYLDILEDIEELQEATVKCSNKERSFSSVMYEVKFLKSQYSEELKEIVQEYNDIIFKDFTFKNDLNTMISGPYALKMWLVRYMCLDNLNTDLSNLINIDMASFSITRQYQEIDVILFKKVMKNKKNILSF